MSSIKVSIVMPSLNVKDYICDCLESVVKQTLKEIEIICVDGGSTDGTLEIIDSFAKADGRIRVIHDEKKSYGYQVNLGMAAAHGEYIGIVETDDVATPNMFERLYDTAKNLNADVVKADFYIVTGKAEHQIVTRQDLTMNLQAYNRIIDPLQDRTGFFSYLATWNGIYRREFLEKHHIKHHESPGASYQDNGFFFQTNAYARSLYVLHEPLYMLRRDNPNSSVVNTKNMVRILEEYRFIKQLLCLDQYLYDHFRNEYFYLFTQNCMWIYEHLLYCDKEKYLKEFRSDLLKLLENNIVCYTTLESHHILFLFQVLHNFEAFIHYTVEPKRLYWNHISQHRKVIIYGAGKYGKLFFDTITQEFSAEDIIGFAVSSKEANDNVCRARKVREIEEYLPDCKQCVVVVAIKEIDKGKLVKKLRRMGFQYLLRVSWEILYKKDCCWSSMMLEEW